MLIIALCVSSCKVYYASRQTEKDNKNIAYAIGRDPVMEKISAYYNAKNPINQKPVIVKERDTIIKTIPDTIALKEALGIIDSLLKNTEIGSSIKDSLIRAIDIIIKSKSDTITKIIGGTVIHDIDSTCAQTLVKATASNNQNIGRNEVLTKNNAELHANLNKKVRNTWIERVVGGLAIIGLIFVRIKKT